MKRFAAHYIFFGQEKIYKQHYLELNKENLIVVILPLENEILETVFHNGILFPVSAISSELSPSEILDSLNALSRLHSGDSIFQLLQRSGFVCEYQNVPVRIFQLNGIDLISLKLGDGDRFNPEIQRIS